jgi:hypothetical protein
MMKRMRQERRLAAVLGAWRGPSSSSIRSASTRTARVWTAGALLIHLVIIRECRKFLDETRHAEAISLH